MSSNEDILKRIKDEASDGRPPIQYRMQFLDESAVDEAVSFMLKYFLPRENIYNSLSGDAQNDKNDIKERKSAWKEKFSLGLSLAAFLEDDKGNRGDLIGCQILSIEERDNPPVIEVSKLTERRQKLIQILKDLKAKADIFTLYGCSSYVQDHGLAVAAEYEGRGIGTELLQAIAQVCRRTNIPITASAFTGGAAQKAAAKCGYQTLAELDLRNYRIDGKIVCSDPKWPVIRWTAKRYFQPY